MVSFRRPSRFAFVLRSAAILSLSVAIVAADGDAGPKQQLSVNEVMVSMVVPASDTLWGIDPPTEDSWQSLDDAAVTIIGAAILIGRGGNGPDDNDWAAEEEWQSYVADLIQAGIAARTAIAERDAEGVIATGDLLYLPCEGCHLAFHPGVSPN